MGTILSPLIIPALVLFIRQLESRIPLDIPTFTDLDSTMVKVLQAASQSSESVSL